MGAAAADSKTKIPSIASRISDFLEENPGGPLKIATGYASFWGLKWLNEHTSERESVDVLIGRTVIDNCDPSVIAAVESGEVAVSDAARQYVWTNPPDIQESAVEIYRQPGAAMTLAHCIDKICQEDEMEERRKKAVADHKQAIAEKEEERLKKLKASGLSEDEFAKEEAARKAAMEAEQEEKEKVYQNEFEMLDDIDPIPPLPFFDENGEPCHVDDIWEVAGDKIVDTKSRASRKVYIAADTEGLLFFRSPENAKKFGIKHVLEMMK